MLPEFDVTVLTFRSGSHTVRVQASDPAAARGLVQGELDSGESHCPAERCTDDVDSTLLDVKQVVLDDVTIIAPTIQRIRSLRSRASERPDDAVCCARSREPRLVSEPLGESRRTRRWTSD
jgi:hypothetical protein